eukprot:scaffold196147_cov14-Tisochrysis_lutea.AAC.1
MGKLCGCVSLQQKTCSPSAFQVLKSHAAASTAHLFRTVASCLLSMPFSTQLHAGNQSYSRMAKAHSVANVSLAAVPQMAF